MFVRYFCEGVEAGTCAACEDNAFHDFYLSREDFFKRMVLKYLNGLVGGSAMAVKIYNLCNTTPQRAPTSYGVECLLRLRGVQVAKDAKLR